MRVLFISSGNRNRIAPFVLEQGSALKNAGVELDYFLIKGKGFAGYLGNLKKLKAKIIEFNPDLVHAHFGLSGALAAMQKVKPKVVTFHGTDISDTKNNIVSSIVSKIADYIITVNNDMLGKLLIRLKKNYSVISCGVDLQTFHPINKSEARVKLGWQENEKVIVFSSSFSNPVKNYNLAKRAIELIKQEYNNLKIIELNDKDRSEVNLILNASDLLLVTSFTEGSPQVVKEAMACNCPIVSTDVGDVREVINDTKGCYLTSFDPHDVVEKIRVALLFNNRTDGSTKIGHLSNELVARKIIDVYNKVLKQKI